MKPETLALYWYVRPKGFPVTSLTHAGADGWPDKTLCGIQINRSDLQWYDEEYNPKNLECERCRKLI